MKELDPILGAIGRLIKFIIGMLVITWVCALFISPIYKLFHPSVPWNVCQQRVERHTWNILWSMLFLTVFTILYAAISFGIGWFVFYISSTLWIGIAVGSVIMILLMFSMFKNVREGYRVQVKAGNPEFYINPVDF